MGLLGGNLEAKKGIRIGFDVTFWANLGPSMHQKNLDFKIKNKIYNPVVFVPPLPVLMIFLTIRVMDNEAKCATFAATESMS